MIKNCVTENTSLWYILIFDALKSPSEKSWITENPFRIPCLVKHFSFRLRIVPALLVFPIWLDPASRVCWVRLSHCKFSIPTNRVCQGQCTWQGLGNIIVLCVDGLLKKWVNYVRCVFGKEIKGVEKFEHGLDNFEPIWCQDREICNHCTRVDGVCVVVKIGNLNDRLAVLQFH